MIEKAKEANRPTHQDGEKGVKRQQAGTNKDGMEDCVR